MMSSNGNIFCITIPLCGEFTDHRWIPTQKPLTRSFDVFFHLCLNKRLSKQSPGWWFETPSRSLWRHCNEISRDKALNLFWLNGHDVTFSINICKLSCFGIHIQRRNLAYTSKEIYLFISQYTSLRTTIQSWFRLTWASFRNHRQLDCL